MTKSQTSGSPSDKPPMDDELELIRRAKQDPRAFEELYRRNVQAIYKYFYNRTQNQAEAEDLTEQTYMVALEGIQRYRENGVFLAWLFTIARNKAVDFFRTNKTPPINLPKKCTRLICWAAQKPP